MNMVDPAAYDMTEEQCERALEYVIQARDGLLTKAEMANKIEALFDQPFVQLDDVVGPYVDQPEKTMVKSTYIARRVDGGIQTSCLLTETYEPGHCVVFDRHSSHVVIPSLDWGEDENRLYNGWLIQGMSGNDVFGWRFGGADRRAT